MSKASQRIDLLNTLRLIAIKIDQTLPIPPDLNQALDIKSTAKQQFELYFKDELIMNDMFDAFATRLRIAYEGKNTIRFQIGYPLDIDYADLSSDDYLPLGEEFQLLVKSFVEDPSNKKYRLYDVRGVMRHLKHSVNIANQTEAERVTMTKLDIKLVQVSISTAIFIN